MASGGGDAKSLTQWLREKGFDEETIGRMTRRCKNLPNLDAGEASGVWDYLLNHVKIEQRKLRYVVTKCPKVLTVSVDGKLIPTVQCLTTLQAKPGEVAQAVVKFPPILFHSVEQKLCPLLAFFQTLDISDKQLAKLLMVNPRLISYSIEGKFSQTVDFFVSLGIEKEGMIGKILTKEPYILGYSVDKRLRPTAEFLKSEVGLQGTDLQRVIMNFPRTSSCACCSSSSSSTSSCQSFSINQLDAASTLRSQISSTRCKAARGTDGKTLCNVSMSAASRHLCPAYDATPRHSRASHSRSTLEARCVKQETAVAA